ncbi:hypothetical protein [Methyloceanibacter superfactus]|uniref:hypothetical protein n=1 Tax=Methyloceanibacter superfactus TaxID=1774969 RepID=UPI00114CA4C1|nr:hypothetical protein [Methyloceanibacter superfactus]
MSEGQHLAVSEPKRALLRQAGGYIDAEDNPSCGCRLVVRGARCPHCRSAGGGHHGGGGGHHGHHNKWHNGPIWLNYSWHSSCHYETKKVRIKVWDRYGNPHFKWVWRDVKVC